MYVKLALSDWKELGNKSVHNLQEQAPLKAVETADGKAVLDVNEMFFRTNYSEINAIAASCTKATVVTIEKIVVTPTDKVALSVQAPVSVEIGTPAEILVEVDEGYTLEWQTSDAQVATVEGNNAKATVTGIKPGEVTITLVVKAADGKEAAKKEIKLTVEEAFKGKDISIDLSKVTKAESNAEGTLKQVKDASGKVTALEVENEAAGLSAELPNKLVTGDKLQVTVKGSFADGSAGFCVYMGKGGVNGSVENPGLGLLGENVKTGPFTCTVELKANGDCSHLCIRVPMGGKITGVTITEILIKYL